MLNYTIAMQKRCTTNALVFSKSKEEAQDLTHDIFISTLCKTQNI